MKKTSLIIITFSAASLIACSVFVFAGGYKKYQKNNSIEEEIERKKQEADRMSGEARLLSEQIEYLKTSEFREQQTKEKLNLKKPGESVVIIKPVPGTEKNISFPRDENVVIHTESDPNWKKWWKFLFFQR